MCSKMKHFDRRAASSFSWYSERRKLRTIGSDLGAAVRGFKQSVNEGEADAAAKQIPPQATGRRVPGFPDT